MCRLKSLQSHFGFRFRENVRRRAALDRRIRLAAALLCAFAVLCDVRVKQVTAILLVNLVLFSGALFFWQSRPFFTRGIAMKNLIQPPGFSESLRQRAICDQIAVRRMISFFICRICAVLFQPGAAWPVKLEQANVPQHLCDVCRLDKVRFLFNERFRIRANK